MTNTTKHSCHTCLLWKTEWKDVEPSPTGLCSWFIKKFQLPKPVPENVLSVGCKNWQ